MNLQTLENIHHHGCGIANTASGRHSACFRKLLRKPANKIYMHCFWDWKVFGESISEACGRVVIKAGGGTEAILQKWVPRKTRCGQVPYQNLICLPKWRGILRIFKQQPGPHLPRTQAPTYIHSLAQGASVWLPFLVRNNALARLICKSPPVRPPAVLQGMRATHGCCRCHSVRGDGESAGRDAIFSRRPPFSSAEIYSPFIL